MPLVANARMYAVDPAVRDLWDALFAWVSERAGQPLAVIEHAAPAPLDDLWRRDDLGLAFACGYPFATGAYPLQAVAAPRTRRFGGRPVYATDLVVRADSRARTLADAFGGRIGWTVEHSQSGYLALLAHLAPMRRENGGAALFAEALGPLFTPRRVVEAVLDGRIDLGPLDSYWHDLLRLHEPDTAARLRVLATTEPTPMPLLVASRAVPPAVVESFRAALVSAGAAPSLHPVLDKLGLAGFAPVEPDRDRPLVEAAEMLRSQGHDGLSDRETAPC